LVERWGQIREELERLDRGVFFWSARHDRGADLDQAVRDLLADPPAPLRSPRVYDWLFEQRQSVDGGLAHLKPIDSGTARRLLAYVLRFDLAYGAEIVDAATAGRLADRVVDALCEPVRWWTNGDVGLPDGGSWTGLTEATFDTGVIGASREHLLIAWVMDED
jgi:hypothetical protein